MSDAALTDKYMHIMTGHVETAAKWGEIKGLTGDALDEFLDRECWKCKEDYDD